MDINPLTRLLAAGRHLLQNRGIVPQARHLCWTHGITVSTRLADGREYQLPTGPLASVRLALHETSLRPPIIRARVGEIAVQAADGLIGPGQVNLSAIHWLTGARVIAVVGLQDGDEGKGRITDLFAVDADIIARTNAGNNARHTIVVNGIRLDLRHIPVGIINPGKVCLIAAGTSVDPTELIEEMNMLRGRGVNFDNLKVSDQAHLVFPIYRLLSRVYDIERGKKFRLGTTAKGTGPSFKAKAAKKGLRICDLYTSEKQEFLKRLGSNVLKAERRYLRKFLDLDFARAIGMEEKTLRAFTAALNRTYGEELVKLLNVALFTGRQTDATTVSDIRGIVVQSESPEARDGKGWDEITARAKPLVAKIFGLTIEPLDLFFDPETVFQIMSLCADIIKPYTDPNIAKLLDDAIRDGKTIVFEQAQGAILDMDQGAYPYVGSSSALAGGASAGAGVGPHHIRQVIGVAKAYLTSTGTSRLPLPTEIVKTSLEGREISRDLSDEEIGRLRYIGGEFGVTVGPRRICWLDIPMLRHSLRVNGATNLAVTHLDALRGLRKIKLCVAYDYPDGTRSNEFITDPNILRQIKPVYEEFEGWSEDISEIRRFEDLPANAQKYIKKVAELTGTMISIIAVGPDRKQTIRSSVMPG